MTAPLALGVDIGGTQLRVALVDELGQVVARVAGRTDVRGGPQANVAQIVALAASLGVAPSPRDVLAIGICAPGPLDTEIGAILDIPTLPGWNGFALRRALGDAFDLPAWLENDGIAAAFGEWKFGGGRDCRHLVYVTVSTGIGGGVVIDGRLLHGRRGMAGHIGHISLDDQGPRCACGAIGCFEALASGTALDEAARARGFVDAAALVVAARNGDVAALELLAHEAEVLGRGFATLAHVYSPERIVMGGGVAKGFDLLARGISASLRRRAMAPFRDIELVTATLGDNAGLVGAAALARENRRA